MNTNSTYDVIVVGGSYAGLSASMALGRSLRKVLVVDSGSTCNAKTPHSHNFLTQDGMTPAAINERAMQQVSQYTTVQLINDMVVRAKRTSHGFEVILRSGKAVFCRKLIFATGIKDQLPDIPGFSPCWGISVIHCPYCHGYEYRGKKTAILASGEAAMHYASLVGNLTASLSIFTNGNAGFTDEQIVKLRKHNISIHEEEIVKIEHESGHLRNIVTKGGDSLRFDALYFRPPFVQHSDIPQAFGCEINEHGYLKVDGFQKTTVEGIYACGDNCSMMRSVANAVSTGNVAGAAVNKDLALEDF
jgi:thioredoxin reductase